MLTLGIDTTTALSAVGLVGFAGGKARTARSLVGIGHAEALPSQVTAILDDAGCAPDDIELIAVAVGPGPYTSTRVGVSFAHGLAFATGASLVGWCTLDVIAGEAAEGMDSPFGVATDARRREIYWALYDVDGNRTCGPRVGLPGAVLADEGRCPHWAGDGFDRFPELVTEAGLTLAHPRYPDPGRLALVSREAWLDAGGDSSPGAIALTEAEIDLDVTSGDGSAVRVPLRRALAPWPLYLRRPDARPLSPESQPITTRPLEWPDIEHVALIERGVFGGDAWSVETFWSELARDPDQRKYLVAERAGVIIGYGGIAWRNGEIGVEADVQTVAVSPVARRRGVARGIVDQLLAAARGRGCFRCLLEVRAENIPAIGLYCSLGFTEIARRPNYYADGGDALVMECRVESPSPGRDVTGP